MEKPVLASKKISTSKRNAEHPFAGRNTQHNKPVLPKHLDNQLFIFEKC